MYNIFTLTQLPWSSRQAADLTAILEVTQGEELRGEELGGVDVEASKPHQHPGYHDAGMIGSTKSPPLLLLDGLDLLLHELKPQMLG